LEFKNVETLKENKIDFLSDSFGPKFLALFFLIGIFGFSLGSISLRSVPCCSSTLELSAGLVSGEFILMTKLLKTLTFA
jgi:hypothetical protein